MNSPGEFSNLSFYFFGVLWGTGINWSGLFRRVTASGGSAVPLLYIEMDGTGIPVAKAATEGRAGKVDGQPAHTREVKLGCLFTQTRTDPEGRPLRDEDSTSYVAAIETAEAFGLRLCAEAWRRGWSRAHKKVVIGDGAMAPSPSPGQPDQDSKDRRNERHQIHRSLDHPKLRPMRTTRTEPKMPRPDEAKKLPGLPRRSADNIPGISVKI
jgi:hypothetical protein